MKFGRDRARIDPSGYDAGKKVKGKKRHIAVDTFGLLVNCAVHPASVQDRDGIALALAGVSGSFPSPDTSPRDDDVADDEAYDLGQGAGFYIDARMSPWSAHYLMYCYITQKLPLLIQDNFPGDTERQGLFGHSMGGHGALVCALRNPYPYHSVSAFAPIVAPSGCPWGVKAFTAYFGDDRERWRRYDACALIWSGHLQSEILVNQGTADPFLEDELKPELLREACAAADQPLTLRMREGYDHSYYFIASFIADHVAHHARILKA